MGDGAHPERHAAAGADERLRKLGTRRGIETLFRSMYRVRMDLTSIADNKANIMITVNGLMLSILLASAGATFDEEPWLLFPIGTALFSSLGAMVFAVLAARPRVIRDRAIAESDHRSKANVLFFGNTSTFGEDEYVDELSELVGDPRRIYQTMMRDLHGIGSVLDHKFSMLQRSYAVFVGGLSVSVVSLAIMYSVAS